MTWNFECLSQQDRAPCRLQLWSTTRIQLMQKSLLLYCTDVYVYDVVGVTQIDLHIPKPVFGHLDLKLAWEMSLSVGARLRANAATCLHVSRCLESPGTWGTFSTPCSVAHIGAILSPCVASPRFWTMPMTEQLNLFCRRTSST